MGETKTEIDLVVLGKSESWDFTEFMTGLVRFGEIEVSSVKDMVEKVLSKTSEKNAKVRRLEIYSHGTDTYLTRGTDVISSILKKEDNQKYYSVLRQLKEVFSENGYVILQICEAGKLEQIIVDIANAVGVRVYANKRGVSPNLPALFSAPFFLFDPKTTGWGTWICAKPIGEVSYSWFLSP